MKETEVLGNGGIILSPTDTIWGLSCDATNQNAINRIKCIKGRDNTKSFIVLVADLDMLASYVTEIPVEALDLMNKTVEPLTFIYSNPVNLPINALSSNGKLGIRIPNHDYCQSLLRSFGKPIVSTSANLSNKPSPLCFDEIDINIKNNVDYIAETERDKRSIYLSSAIYIIEDNKLKQLR